MSVLFLIVNSLLIRSYANFSSVANECDRVFRSLIAERYKVSFEDVMVLDSNCGKRALKSGSVSSTHSNSRSSTR
jgi:uncharacterized phosphosugar-binding protein